MQRDELKSTLKDSFEQRERLCSEVGSVADAFMGPTYFLLLKEGLMYLLFGSTQSCWRVCERRYQSTSGGRRGHRWSLGQ